MSTVMVDIQAKVAEAAPELAQLVDPTPLQDGRRWGVHLVRSSGEVAGVYTIDSQWNFCAGRVINTDRGRLDTLDLDIFCAALKAAEAAR